MNNKKFRVWHKDLQKYLPNDEWCINFAGNLCFIDLKGITEDYLVEVPEKMYVIEQFTGLLDKSGREIFENDIVKYTYWYREWDTIESEYPNSIVKFIDGKFTPIPEEEKCDEDGWYSWGRKNFEIIGNINQNPELLKENK